ncbi:MAG: MFS transporter [Myxococcota bacterium]
MAGVLALIMLDETIIGVALPTIRRDLSLSQTGSHWVVNAYLLVFASLSALGGKLYDLFSIKRTFFAGVVLFALASLACGFARDGAWLVGFRVVQGIGAAVIFPGCVAIITRVFPEHQRGMAFGVQTAVGGVSMALGPLVGGVLTQSVSWRWIFWVNPPLALLVAAAMLLVWQSPSSPSQGRQFDAPGLMSFVVGITSIVLATMQGAVWGWSSAPTVSLFVLGVLALCAFVRIELRAPQPLIHLELFRREAFAVGNLVIFVAEASKITFIIFGALYAQDVLHLSPLSAGLAITISIALSPISSILAGRLADRHGARRPTLVGLALQGSAFCGLALAVVGRKLGFLAPPAVLWGASLPFVYVPPRRAVMSAAPIDKGGQAGGVSMTAQLLGGTVGMSVSGALYVATHDFSVLFWVCGGCELAVLLVAWLALGKHSTGKVGS